MADSTLSENRKYSSGKEIRENGLTSKNYTCMKLPKLTIISRPIVNIDRTLKLIREQERGWRGGLEGKVPAVQTWGPECRHAPHITYTPSVSISICNSRDRGVHGTHRPATLVGNEL